MKIILILLATIPALAHASCVQKYHIVDGHKVYHEVCTLETQVRLVEPKAVPIVLPTHVPAVKVKAPQADGMTLPPNAVPYMQLLKDSIANLWPDMPMRSFFGAMIEQETCASLTGSACWNPHTELHTSREWGAGLGQLTIAYNTDGSVRFDAMKELVAKHKELSGWTWNDRFNVEMQLKAIVIKNKVNWSLIKYQVADFDNRMAFLAVMYNSGSPVLDIRLCKTIPGCKPDTWWSNVELHSVKSQFKAPGYGQSFFEISRVYPKNVVMVRRTKYVPYLDM